MIKSQYLSDGGATIDKDSLETAEQADDSLQENNIGHKLLQMMGWSGGGLGKEGAGISGSSLMTVCVWFTDFMKKLDHFIVHLESELLTNQVFQW